MKLRMWVPALLLSLPVLGVHAGETGHFRKGEVRLVMTHAIAVRRDEDVDPARARTMVYLSDVPLDAGKIASAFSDSQEAVSELPEGQAGYVRICIDADGSECGLYFSHNQPTSSFNSSGSGEFKLTVNDGKRIVGRWTQATPKEFFGETYDYDLPFDAVVVAPLGTPLPADGGAPAQAYRQWIAALARGDVATLRTLAAEDADNAWQLRSDDANDVKSALKDLRDGTPVTVAILRGRSEGDQAVLWVTGTDRDEIKRQGRVLMRREGGVWKFAEASLEDADD